jgi:hypothetical protein
MQMNLINSRNALPEAAKHIQQTRCLSYSRNAYPVAEMPIQQPSCLFSRRKAYPTAKMFDQKLSSLSRKKSFLAKYRKIPLWYSSGSYKKIKPPPFKIPRICKILLDETSSDEDNEWFDVTSSATSTQWKKTVTQTTNLIQTLSCVDTF